MVTSSELSTYQPTRLAFSLPNSLVTFLFIYFERERVGEGQRERERERESQAGSSSLLSAQSPMGGLNSPTVRS